MNRLFQVIVLLCAAFLIGAGVASADTLQFVLTGPTNATFDLSSSPSIMAANSDPGFGFTVIPTNLIVNGSAAPGDFLGFYNADPAAGGGVAIFASESNMTAYASGPQLYSGPEGNPTFAPGTFTLDNGALDTPVPGAYTLTITDLSTVPTPEPSVTILLAVGLLALGLVVLRFKPNRSISAS